MAPKPPETRPSAWCSSAQPGTHEMVGDQPACPGLEPTGARTPSSNTQCPSGPGLGSLTCLRPERSTEEARSAWLNGLLPPTPPRPCCLPAALQAALLPSGRPGWLLWHFRMITRNLPFYSYRTKFTKSFTPFLWVFFTDFENWEYSKYTFTPLHSVIIYRYVQEK